MGTVSEVVVLRCRRLWWKELVECVVWIVASLVEQVIVTLLQQLIEFRQIRRAEAASIVDAGTHQHVGGLSR